MDRYISSLALRMAGLAAGLASGLPTSEAEQSQGSYLYVHSEDRESLRTAPEDGEASLMLRQTQGPLQTTSRNSKQCNG